MTCLAESSSGIYCRDGPTQIRKSQIIFLTVTGSDSMRRALLRVIPWVERPRRQPRNLECAGLTALWFALLYRVGTLN